MYFPKKKENEKIENKKKCSLLYPPADSILIIWCGLVRPFILVSPHFLFFFRKVRVPFSIFLVSIWNDINIIKILYLCYSR